MNVQAYAAVKFADACLRGLRGDAGVVHCAFVSSQVLLRPLYDLLNHSLINISQGSCCFPHRMRGRKKCFIAVFLIRSSRQISFLLAFSEQYKGKNSQ